MSEGYTIADAAQVWLKRCERDGLERSTLRAYRMHCERHIVPRIGARELATLTAPEVRSFLDDLLDATSKATARKVMISLRSLIAEAQSRGWVNQNVARDVKLRKGGRDAEERVFPTKEEIRKLLENAPERHKPLLVTAIFTGMRASELRGLAWEHVDFEKRYIYVRQRADRWGELGPPKSRAGRRDIPMTPLVWNTLKAWRKECPPGDLGLVFPNGAGKPELLSNWYRRIFRPLMVRCGIVNTKGNPRFGFHALRHAAAPLFIEQGWPPKRVQTILGHASITMTFDVYGHLFRDPEGELASMEKLEKDLLAA